MSDDRPEHRVLTTEPSAEGGTRPSALEPRPYDEDEISLLDILIVLAKHKKLILGLPLLAAIVTAGITLLMPNWYTATTKILPPHQQQSTAAAMLGQLGALSGFAPSALGIKNPNDLYVGILKSRTIADAVIERFKLKELYEAQTQEDCPDLRNSRVVDIVSSLHAYNARIDSYDPWIDPRDAQSEYGLSPLGEEPRANTYDAIVLAVAHRQFTEWGAERIRSFGRTSHVLYDVKALLPKGAADVRL